MKTKQDNWEKEFDKKFSNSELYLNPDNYPKTYKEIRKFYLESLLDCKKETEKDLMEEYDKWVQEKNLECITSIHQAIAEERERLVGIAKGMKKERTADRQLYTWDGKVEQIKYFHNDSDVGYNNAVMDFITSLQEKETKGETK